jgi:hypothetical protein
MAFISASDALVDLKKSIRPVVCELPVVPEEARDAKKSSIFCLIPEVSKDSVEVSACVSAPLTAGTMDSALFAIDPTITRVLSGPRKR